MASATAFVGFSDGYVGVAVDSGGTSLAPDADRVAWFSQDGLHWSATPLMRLATNCPDWGPDGDEMVWDGETGAIATDGNSVVVVGEVFDYESAPCGRLRPVSWVSSDGRTWERSAPWVSSEADLRATRVWPVPGGWQAGSEWTTWESTDGLAWNPIPGALAPLDAAAAAPDGTVLALWGAGTGSDRLQTSSDGRTWSKVVIPATCPAGSILPPARVGLDAWVIWGVGVCTSRDLATWTATPLDVGFYDAAQTRYGAILLGDRCYDLNRPCDQTPRAYLSVDSREWQPLPDIPAPAWSIADGPAGVLLIGGDLEATGSVRVWRLAPG